MDSNSKPMRILHVLGALNRGGAETMIMNIYRNIDKSKIQFDFIIHTGEKCDYTDEVLSLGGKIYSFPKFNARNFIQLIKIWKNFFSEHVEYKILHSHIRSYASLYIPIAKKNKVFTIIHSHSISNGKGVSSIIKLIMQYPLRFEADCFFACSKEAGEWLYGKKIVKSTKFKIINNCIQTTKFIFDSQIRKQMREELGIDNEIVIGHVGRMTEAKNHLFLLDVFKEFNKNNNSTLLLVGDGELMDQIKKYAIYLKLKKKIIFVGSQENVEKYYQAMDIFVFPSLWEGLGIVIIEAQASGLPCVISNNIPSSVDIKGGLVQRIDIDKGADFWAKEISNHILNERHNMYSFIKNASYDISESVRWFEIFYSKVGTK